LGINEGMEIFYKSKLSFNPKRKVSSYVGRLYEEGKFLNMHEFLLIIHAFQ